MAAIALTPALLTPLLRTYPQIRRLIVGYSGGLDSHVLLHLLAAHPAFRLEKNLSAIYIDHALQPASVAWGDHCARICSELAVPFKQLRVAVRPAAGESPEAAARRYRYAALAAELSSDTALLTAHHCNDQAETLLLQLLRGAGPHGLAAMPDSARLGPGWLLRPLLEIDRKDLLIYANSHHLTWIEDPTNADPAFERNRLRHQILPLLAAHWPAVNRNLARAARLCAETAEWLDAEAEADLAGIVTEQADALHLPALGALREIRQRNVVRYWLRRLGLPIPHHRQLVHALNDSLRAGRDRQPCVRWPGAEIRRYQERLYAMPPLPPHDPYQTFIWKMQAGDWPPLTLSGLGRLRMQKTMGMGLRPAALSDTLIVRFRTGGERFHPAGRKHSQQLKKLLQDAGIAPWRRDRLPLVYAGEMLAMVVGLGIAADQAVSANETGWLPMLESPAG